MKSSLLLLASSLGAANAAAGWGTGTANYKTVRPFATNSWFANDIDGRTTIDGYNSAKGKFCTCQAGFLDGVGPNGGKFCGDSQCTDDAVGTNCDKTCNKKTKCNWLSGVNTNSCVAADGKCSCSRTNVEGDNCDKCKSGFFGWPYCDQKACDSATDCNGKGTCNTDYFQLKFATKGTSGGRTQCGNDLCGETEQCCPGAISGHYTQARKNGPSNWMAMKTAPFCKRKGYTCCGTSSCNPGELCIDAETGTCTTGHWKSANLGKTACWGGNGNGQQLANGTYTSMAPAPNAYCLADETCCDGTCCKGTETCEDMGKHVIAADDFGWDIRTHKGNTLGNIWSWSTQHNGKALIGQYCDSKGMNVFHGMRIIALPIFLTFAYLIGIALGVKTGCPMPIKIVGLVMLVLCIFQAYHYEWQYSAITAMVVILTLFATGNASNKPSWTPFALIIAQFVLFSVYFRVNIFGVLVSTSQGNLKGLKSRDPFTDCHNQYDYFKTDMRHFGIDNYPNNYANALGDFQEQFFGFCAPGWIACMDFFIALNGFLLLLLMTFTFKAVFNDDGASGKSTVMPQEVEIA